MHEICTRYAWDMPKICSRYAWDISKICPRYAKDMPKKWPHVKRSWQNVFLTNRLRRSWQNVFLKKCLLTTYWLFVASAKKTFSSLHGSFISAVTVSVQYSGVKVYKVEQFHPRDSEFVWLQNRLQNSILTLFAYMISWHFPKTFWLLHPNVFGLFNVLY